MKIPFITHAKAQKAPLQKIEKHIEIVTSNNPRLNDLPEDARRTILTVLRKHYTKVAVTIVDSFPDLERLVAKRPDLVILGMGLVPLDSSKSYDASPKVWLSTYLEENNIAHTGSGIDALILQRNKNDAKQEMLNAGLRTAPYFVVRTNQSIPQHNLTFPLFVKPTNRGDGKGIDEKSLVYSALELDSKVLSIHKDCGSDALVEEYLPGREFSVAVLQQDHSNSLLAMPIEITTPADKKGNSFLSEAVKKADLEKASTVDNPALKVALNTLAIAAFKALGARDYGRIDLRLDSLGIPNFIEANLMPGLSDHGYLSRCFALNESISYENMILSIVSLGLQRTHKTNSLAAQLPENTIATPLAAPDVVLS
jgi:D-alanine-D-alanine ligase